MEQDHVAPKTADQSASVPAHVIVDLGKKSKKAIKKLKRGKGPLPLEVEEAIHKAVLHLFEGDKDKQIVPVVVIYGQKRKRVSLPSLPFSPLNLFR